MILKSYPSLDVHGETRYTVIYPVKQFIKENFLMQNNHIVIIHGIGQGILRKTVHDILKKDSLVASFHLDGLNLGATEVTLKTLRQSHKKRN